MFNFCLQENNEFALSLLKLLNSDTYKPQLKAMLESAQSNELKPLRLLWETGHETNNSSVYNGITFYQLCHKIQPLHTQTRTLDDLDIQVSTVITVQAC